MVPAQLWAISENRIAFVWRYVKPQVEHLNTRGSEVLTQYPLANVTPWGAWSWISSTTRFRISTMTQ